eukprot:357929-Chlamydomonas_euryale.AAC.1
MRGRRGTLRRARSDGGGNGGGRERSDRHGRGVGDQERERWSMKPFCCTLMKLFFWPHPLRRQPSCCPTSPFVGTVVSKYISSTQRSRIGGDHPATDRPASSISMAPVHMAHRLVHRQI